MTQNPNVTYSILCPVTDPRIRHLLDLFEDSRDMPDCWHKPTQSFSQGHSDACQLRRAYE